MDEKVKIELLMKEFNLNSAQFAEEVGIKIATLSHILNDRNKPSLDVLKKILSRFKQINPEWLILDNGAMFRQILNSQEPTLFDNVDLNSSNSVKYVQEIQSENTTKTAVIQNNPTVTEESNIKYGSNSNQSSFSPEIPPAFASKIEYRSKSISKIIIYYDDNTFEEFSTNK
ncbi:MAG: helix-turn-helix domain-containing protein [Paludibacter sp.]